MKDRPPHAGREPAGGARVRILAGLALSAIGATLLVPLHSVAQGPPPDARYLTIPTAHFRVTFPEEIETLGRRAAVLAEEAHALLSSGFFPAPAGTIDLLLTDHADAVFGEATPFPSNRVTIWAQPPLDGLALSHFDDWLELVITHEVAHIFHLDYVGTPGRVLRTVFGRPPERWPYYSASAVPFAAIEGIAVYEELALHGSGRLHGAFHEAVVRARVSEGEVDRVDQGIGLSPVWPGASRRYVYGSLFMEHLVRSYGEGAVVRFLEAAAEQWIPFRMDAAAREAFGAPFGTLWDEWMEAVTAEVATLRSEIEARAGAGPRPGRAGGTPIELLTEGGGAALYPDAGAEGVAYSREDDRSDIQLRLWTPAGDRSLGRWNTAHAPPRWGPDGSLVAPDLELVDDYRLRRDLRAVRLDGEVRRLTNGLRVLHADPHPAGGSVVAVVGAGTGNRLVLLDAEGEIESVLREEEAGVLWSFPAWSPDGGRLAVARRLDDGRSAIVILDGNGELVAEIVEDRSQNTHPAWAPDGSLLWGSDRSGVPNLYAVSGSALDPVSGSALAASTPATAPALPLLQVTDLLTGAAFPSVSPDGGWVYLSLLGADGWALGRTPYDPGGWRPAPPPIERFLAAGPPVGAPPPIPTPPGEDVAPYSPFPTLVPRYWLPVRVGGEGAGGEEVIGDRWGARTSGHDLLARHQYAAWAAVPLARPFGRSEGSLWYRWSGLGDPALSFEAEQDWAVRGSVLVEGVGAEPDETFYPAARERRVGAELEFRRRRVRSIGVLSVGARWIREDRRLLDADGRESDVLQFVLPSATLVEPRATLAASTARAHPFSVSLEEGATGVVTFRARRQLALADSLSGVAGVDGSLWDVTGVLQGYRGIPLFGFADHVLAVRIAGGISGGSGAGAQHFGVGGGGGFFGVRGVPDGDLRFGSAWAVSAEWRFPVALLNRGVGAWPFHADRLAGALFWDLAGGREEAGSSAGSTGSFGVEAVLSYSFLFDDPAWIRAGVAFPSGSRNPSLHVASAWSF